MHTQSSIFAGSGFWVKLGQQKLQRIERGDVAGAGDEAGFDEVREQRGGRALAEHDHLLDLAARGRAGNRGVVDQQRGVYANAFLSCAAPKLMSASMVTVRSLPL